MPDSSTFAQRRSGHPLPSAADPRGRGEASRRGTAGTRGERAGGFVISAAAVGSSSLEPGIAGCSHDESHVAA